MNWLSDSVRWLSRAITPPHKHFLQRWWTVLRFTPRRGETTAVMTILFGTFATLKTLAFRLQSAVQSVLTTK